MQFKMYLPIYNKYFIGRCRNYTVGRRSRRHRRYATIPISVQEYYRAFAGCFRHGHSPQFLPEVNCAELLCRRRTADRAYTHNIPWQRYLPTCLPTANSLQYTRRAYYIRNMCVYGRSRRPFGTCQRIIGPANSGIVSIMCMCSLRFFIFWSLPAAYKTYGATTTTTKGCNVIISRVCVIRFSSMGKSTRC